MSHLDEGQLHELLDGELDEPARTAALAHLASCERCKAAYDEAAGFLAEADALIDAVQIPAAPVAVMATAAAPEPAVIPLPVSSPRLRTMRALAWAASIVAAVGIGWVGSGLSRPAVPALEPVAATSTTALSDAPTAAPASAPAPAPAPVLAEADQVAKSARREDRQAPAAAGAAPEKSRAKVAAEETLPVDAALASADVAAERRSAEVANVAPPAAAPMQARPSAAGTRQELSGFMARSLGLPTSFRVIGMEEGVRILGGSIRLIDGMTPTRLLAGRGAGPAVVRVVYEDPPGRELWLDQSRVSDKDDERARDATTLLPGDTLMVVKEAGNRSLGWVDQHGFQLRLTGYMATDSLQALQARVR